SWPAVNAWWPSRPRRASASPIATIGPRTPSPARRGDDASLHRILRLRAIALALRVLRLRAIALALRVLRLRAIALALRVLRLRAIALALRAGGARAGFHGRLCRACQQAGG